MTIDVTTPIQTHTIAGTGPYGTTWPYAEGSVAVGIVDADGIVTYLDPADYTVDPASTTTAGNVTLTGPVAAANAGATLYLERQTPEEQGWIGNLSARERGLETQLDLIVMAAQERRGGVDRSLRATVPLAPFAPGAIGTTLIRTANGYGPGPSVDQIEDAQENAETATAAALLATQQAAFVADARQLVNFSSPQARTPVVLYVDMAGTDPTDTTVTWLEHGLTPATAFRTWEAALAHAKFRHRFGGRLNSVELRFGPGDWGFFSLGSNLIQAQDYYPFAIIVTCADDLDRPRFNGITIGSFVGSALIYATKVELGYTACSRNNTIVIHDVGFWNYGAAYGILANVEGTIFVFGDLEILEPCTYATAFLYAQLDGFISLENGDVPLIFPQVNIINPGNITSPWKYRIVNGGSLWASSNVYPQLTYAAKFWRDETSISIQDNTDNAFKLVATNTGTAGYERWDNGRVEQWGTFALTSVPVGETLNLDTLNFPFAMPNGSYIIEFHTNSPRIMVTRESGSSASACPYSVRNFHAAAADATVYWRVIGYI